MTESESGQQAPSNSLAAHFERLLPHRLARFILIGGFNTIVGYLLFAVLQLTLGAHVHYVLVLVISTAIGIVVAYAMQRWFVWRVRGHWWSRLVRFSGVYAAALVVNAALLPLLHEGARVPVLVAQAGITLLNTLGTFVAHRSFTFRPRDHRTPSPPNTLDND